MYEDEDQPFVDLYTEEVKKHIYQVKPRLKGFPLITDDRIGFIAICIPMKEFNPLTVERRLEIALELEQLRTLIEGEGIRCVIEKD